MPKLIGGAGVAALAIALALHGASAQAVPATTPTATATGKPAKAPRLEAFLDDLAQRLHVDRSALNAALSGAEKDEVQARVTAGKITQEQATQIDQQIDQQGPAGVLRSIAGAHKAGKTTRGAAGRAGKNVIDAVSSATGIPAAQIRQQLKDGKSLVEIGATAGKSESDLQAAITASVKQRLDAQVQAGKITVDQEQRLLQAATSHLDKLLNRHFTKKA